MFITVAIGFLLRLSISNAGDPCPPETELAPCTCSCLPIKNWTSEQSEIPTTAMPPISLTTPRRKRETNVNSQFSPSFNDSYTVVNCKALKSLTVLEGAVTTALHRKLVDKLVIANIPPSDHHTLARLPSGWLKEMRVRQFEALDSKLSGDFISDGNPFEGQSQSLLWFAAKNCFLCGSLTYETVGTVKTKGLNALPRIEGVDFSDNFLTAIMATSFRYPPTNLSSVILSNNSITYIESGTFQHIPLLKYIDLSRNFLGNVVRTIFASPAKRLEHIDLSWNSLNLLPVDFFINLPSLKIVNLSNNFLYSMPERPWGAIWRQLAHVDLTGNFLECNCDLMWILPILSPPKVQVTSTPVPEALPGQTILGVCTKTVQPDLFAMKYELVTLTRDRLTC